MSSLPPAPGLLVVSALRLEGLALRRGAPGLALLRSGVGPGRARRAAEDLARHPARRIAVVGLCGALDPELSPGDVLIASRVSAEDVPARDIEPAEVASLEAALQAQGIPARVGPLLSTARLVHGAERETLRRAGAVAVDMESAWLAEGAGSRPLALVRVVMDGPRHELLRPATAGNLLRGLAMLRRLAPALEDWRPVRATDSGAGAPAGVGGAARPRAARG